MTTTDLLDDIGHDVEPCRKYMPEELIPLLGYSRSCIYKLIANGSIYATEMSGRILVTGSSILHYIRYHRDELEVFSSYGGREKLVKPKPYMQKPKKHPYRWLSDLRDKVFQACDRLQARGEGVTVRAVEKHTGGRTEYLCQGIAEWRSKHPQVATQATT
jgi:hypothetical protein